MEQGGHSKASLPQPVGSVWGQTDNRSEDEQGQLLYVDSFEKKGS